MGENIKELSSEKLCCNHAPQNDTGRFPVPAQVSTYTRRASQMTDMDDDITLTDVTVTSHHASHVTMDSTVLSLPDSFDDAFVLSEKLYKGDEPRQYQMPLYSQQLKTAKRKIDALYGQIKTAKCGISNVSITNQEYDRLSQKAKEDLNLFEFFSLAINEALKTKREEFEAVKTKLEKSIIIAEQQRDEAVNARRVHERREKCLNDSLEGSEQKQYELEKEIRSLKDVKQDLYTKKATFERMESSIEKSESNLKKTQESVQTLRNKISEIDTERKNLQKSKKEMEQKILLLEMDKTYLQKENVIIKERVQKAESDCKRNEKTLEETLTKNENLILKLSETRYTEKNECEEKLASEIKLAREESKIDFRKTMDHARNLYERENNLLRESKQEISERLESVSNELHQLRIKYEDIITEKTELTSKLERNISEIQSELNLRSFEIKKMTDHNEIAESELVSLRSENESLREKVMAHETQFNNLEKESLYEKKRLTEELARKNEQLKINATARKYDKQCSLYALSDETLIEKLGESDRRINELRNKVNEQMRENERLGSKSVISENVLNGMKGSPNYIIESLKMKEQEISTMRNDKINLQRELGKLKEENQDLSKKIGEISQKQGGPIDTRNTKDEMSLLANHGNIINDKTSIPECIDSNAHLNVNNELETYNVFNNNKSALSLHLVHHGGKRLRVKNKGTS